MINLAIGGSKVKSTIHDDKKSLKFEFCGITYSGKSNLNTHTALVHEKKNSNVCLFCYISVSQKGRNSAYMYSIHTSLLVI